MSASVELLLTVEQLAVVLEISEWTIKALVKAGTLPHLRLGKRGGKLRFDVAVLSEYFNRHEGGLL